MKEYPRKSSGNHFSPLSQKTLHEYVHEAARKKAWVKKDYFLVRESGHYVQPMLHFEQRISYIEHRTPVISLKDPQVSNTCQITVQKSIIIQPYGKL